MYRRSAGDGARSSRIGSRPARAALRMLSSRFWPHSVSRPAWVQSGFGITSMAPISSAVTARSAWVVHITTGRGCWRINFLRKVRPSILGISTSSRMTPGTESLSRSTASYGSAARTTWNRGSPSMIDLSRWRITALSLTTSTSIDAGSG